MEFEEVIEKAENDLFRLGLPFWANKLKTIRQSEGTPSIKAGAVLALYGGFGTLNDNAFSDNDAPPGMSGEEATRNYFNTINALHEAAKEKAGKRA